jgi:hypothetical protein
LAGSRIFHTIINREVLCELDRRLADTRENLWWLRAADIRAAETAGERAEEIREGLPVAEEVVVRIAAVVDLMLVAEEAVVRMLEAVVEAVVRAEEAGAVVAGGAGADNFLRR